jgi:hypothetical protein
VKTLLGLISLAVGLALLSSTALAQEDEAAEDPRIAAAAALLEKQLQQLGDSLRSLGLGPNSKPESFCFKWLASSERNRGDLIDTGVDLLLVHTDEERSLRECVKLELRSGHPHIDRACTAESEFGMPTPSDFMALLRLGDSIRRQFEICRLAKEIRAGTP